MDYKVLYRKYRPTDFSNIIDQEYITTILKNSIINNKMSHAYIFSGPRGTGKTTTAKVFAKAINCDNLSENGPCGECDSCKNFNNNPDIIELDAASNNGVNEIREIIENVRITPTYSKYKVYIIDEAHMLTQNAFNALLLTLEEPPKNVIFILATTNIENIPITILSRCQRFDFKKISTPAMIERLKYVCQQENINISQEALLSIAELADGGLRDALSILDQARNENGSIEVKDIDKIFSIVPKEIINKVINNFVDNNIQNTIDAISELKDRSYNYKNLVKSTIIILRKISISKLLTKEYSDYLKLKNVMVELNKTLNEINVYVDPMIIFESCFLSYMIENDKIENNTKFSEKVINTETKKEKIENQNYFPGNNFDENLIKKFINIRVNNCFVNPKKTLLEQIKKQWPKFIDSINDNNILSLFVDVMPVCVSENYMILSSNSIGNSELINMNSNKYENIIYEYFKINYKIVVLTSSEWQEFKNNYINDLKNGIKYNLMDDLSIENENLNNDNDIISIAGNVFDNSKIEYE